MMPQPVFISYARDTSREDAKALHEALGGRTAFLDTEAIEPGDSFPEALVDALFDARVVVIFAEPRYFTRWYCLLEFRIARTPFLRVAERPNATSKEQEDAIRGLVVAMPRHAIDPMMERFPPLVQARSWPAVDDTNAIAALVNAELAAAPPTLRERYASVARADEARTFLMEATRLPPPQRIGNLPFVPQIGLPRSIADAFVGRADDLWRIHDLLWTERGDPATAAGLTGAIEATGRFGKTRLALEYLYRFGPRYFDGGLFWINAESDAELQLYDVLQALNPQAPAIELVRQTSSGVPGAVARAVRSQPEDRSTPLFIIDNVPEPAAGQQPRPLETWCPVLGEVSVLTTSRTRVALGAGGGVVAFPIETLDPESAVRLLTMETERSELDDAGWSEIAAWVGHLPLALEVLNRLLRSGEMTPRALLALTREQRPSTVIDQAMESVRSVVPAGALRGITEAFSASYDLLTEREQSAARLIAWMAPAPVPTFVIDTFGPEAFAPGVRSKLRNRSLVTAVREGSGAFFGAMHRVLADFIRARSPDPVGEVEFVSSLLTQLMEGAEGRGSEGSACVRDCAPLASAVFANWITGPASESEFSTMWAFASGAGSTLVRWGYPALAAGLFASLASASARRLGEEHPDTLSSLHALANTHRERGDLRGAREVQERVLEARRRILGHEHPDTLMAMNNLSITQSAQGDLAGARKLQETMLKASQRVLGHEHEHTLMAMGHLAITRAHQGDYTGAQELEEVVLEGRRRLGGEEHRETLNAMNNLAFTLAKRSDHAGAQALQERVLEMMIRIRGAEHPATLTAMGNLASTLRARGDHDAAQALQERALDAQRCIRGDEHPDTLDSVDNLALTLHARGDHAEAQELQERVVTERRRVLGEEHPDTLMSMHNLAATLRARRDHVAARELQRRALEARRRILGNEHPDTLMTMSHLARSLHDLGDHAEARELQESAVEAMRRILGEEHPDTISAMDYLALMRRGYGRHQGEREPV
jgi:tetratricopeptide (TPR) repeat protein